MSIMMHILAFTLMCCAFVVCGIFIGMGYVRLIANKLKDSKFRIVVDGNEKLYVANKVVTERWIDGLAVFEVIDLKEYKQ